MSDWISIKKELPAIGIPVLVVVQYTIPSATVAILIDEHHWQSYDAEGEAHHFWMPVSHWMRIPVFPIVAQSEPELPL